MTGFKYHRRRTALSPQEIAGILGIRHQTVYNWENGKAIPHPEMLIKVAKLYGTTIDELLQDYPDPVAECRSRLEEQNNGTG